MIDKNIIDRFWSYVEVKGEDDCWLWKKSCYKQGYGAFGIKNKTKLAHRIAYEIVNGAGLAKGFMVRHTCDNPPCCNPRHLIGGTAQDNMTDKIVRGRARNLKGTECSWSKLNEKDVRVIKQMLKNGAMQKTIAMKFGVKRQSVADIAYGRTWGHV